MFRPSFSSWIVVTGMTTGTVIALLLNYGHMMSPGVKGTGYIIMALCLAVISGRLNTAYRHRVRDESRDSGWGLLAYGLMMVVAAVGLGYAVNSVIHQLFNGSIAGVIGWFLVAVVSALLGYMSNIRFDNIIRPN